MLIIALLFACYALMATIIDGVHGADLVSYVIVLALIAACVVYLGKGLYLDLRRDRDDSESFGLAERLYRRKLTTVFFDGGGDLVLEGDTDVDSYVTARQAKYRLTLKEPGGSVQYRISSDGIERIGFITGVDLRATNREARDILAMLRTRDAQRASLSPVAA